MSGADLHNLQVTLSQIPHVQKLTEPTHNNPLNQVQTLSALAEVKREKERSKVKELTESEATNAEDSTKAHHQKQADTNRRHIDIKI